MKNNRKKLKKVKIHTHGIDNLVSVQSQRCYGYLNLSINKKIPGSKTYTGIWDNKPILSTSGRFSCETLFKFKLFVFC